MLSGNFPTMNSGYEFADSDQDDIDPSFFEDETFTIIIASPTEAQQDSDNNLLSQFDSLTISFDEEEKSSAKSSAKHDQNKRAQYRHGSCMLDTKGTSTARLNEILIQSMTPSSKLTPTNDITVETKSSPISLPQSPSPAQSWFESYQSWCQTMKETDGKAWLDDLESYRAVEKIWLENNPQWKQI